MKGLAFLQIEVEGGPLSLLSRADEAEFRQTFSNALVSHPDITIGKEIGEGKWGALWEVGEGEWGALWEVGEGEWGALWEVGKVEWDALWEAKEWGILCSNVSIVKGPMYIHM